MSIPKTDFDVEMVHVATNVPKAMKDLGATAEAGGPWMVPFEKLHIMDGLNVRVTDTPAYRQRVKDYEASIEAHGFMRNKPLTAVLLNVDNEPTLFVTDGHTRYEALRNLKAARKKIGMIPVILMPPSTTTKELNAAMGQGNEATPLTMFEKAILAKRYEAMQVPKAEIATQMGVSTKQVENLLVLAGAPTKLRNFVLTNKLSGTDAVKLIREHGDKASDVAAEALDVAAASGKAKASRKHVKKTEKGKKKEAERKQKKTADKTPETKAEPDAKPEVGTVKKPSKWKNGLVVREVAKEDGRTVVEITGNFKAGTILPAKETVALRYLTGLEFWQFVDGSKDSVVIEDSVVIHAEMTVFLSKPPAPPAADTGTVDAAIAGL